MQCVLLAIKVGEGDTDVTLKVIVDHAVNFIQDQVVTDV